MLQLVGDLVVLRDGRIRPVPRPPVGIEDRVGYGRKCRVNFEALLRWRDAIRGRAYQRVSEADRCTELDESLQLGGARRVPTESELLGGTPQQRRVPQRFGRGQGEQAPRVRRQRSQSLREAV